MTFSFRHCEWAFLLGLLVSCQTLPRPENRPGAITHVVICWLKEPGNPDARRQLVEASKTFRSIPGVVDVSVGPVLPSLRTQVDASFDIAVVMTFTDPEALEYYAHHPIHQQATREVLQPLVRRYVVYDFVNQ